MPKLKFSFILISLVFLIPSLIGAQVVELKELGRAPFYTEGKIDDPDTARKFFLEKLPIVEFILYQQYYEDGLRTLSKEDLGAISVEAIDFQPGYTVDWMIFSGKTEPKGIKVLEVLENVRWAGEKPFKAFLIETKDYSFIIPVECGNISLWRPKVIR